MSNRFRYATLGGGLLLVASALWVGSDAYAGELRFKMPNLNRGAIAVDTSVSEGSTVAALKNRYIRQVVHEEPTLLAQANPPGIPGFGPVTAPPSPVQPPRQMNTAEQDLKFPEMRPQPQTPIVPKAPAPEPPSPYPTLQTPRASGSTATATADRKEEPVEGSTSQSSEAVSAPATMPRATLPKAAPPVTVPSVAGTQESPLPAAPLPRNEGLPRTVLEIDCPESAGVRSIKEIDFDIRPKLDGGELPKECPLAGQDYQPRQYTLTCYRWKAAALCTKGAYFQDVQTERYGHSVCPTLQPIISGARFFADVLVLPYKMGLETPNECVYTLGYHRVGNCAPYMLDPLPLSVRGALFEGAAVAGAVLIVP